MELNLIYTGDSMLGTFTPGDRLVIQPASIAEIKRGDIIAYYEAGPAGDRKKTILVHRVLFLDTSGLITQGDANPAPDKGRVMASQIIGKVIQRIINHNKKKVRGGWRGLIRAGYLHMSIHLHKLARKCLRRPYRYLKKQQLLERIWHPEIKKIIVHSGQEEVLKYVHGNKVVGYVWPDRGSYKFKKPYDLILKSPQNRY